MQTAGRSEADFDINLETREGLETGRKILVSSLIMELSRGVSSHFRNGAMPIPKQKGLWRESCRASPSVPFGQRIHVVPRLVADIEGMERGPGDGDLNAVEGPSRLLVFWIVTE
jgi:hypothetical protein